MAGSSSVLPFPIIVLGTSTAVSLLVITAACALRRHQKAQLVKQTRSLTPRKLSTPSINSSSAASFHRHSASGQQHHAPHNNQNQLSFEPRFLPSLHSASLADMICHQKCGLAQPTIEIAMSRCSCCGDQYSEVSATRTYEQCFNESFVTSSSHSHHSVHCGHWTWL